MSFVTITQRLSYQTEFWKTHLNITHRCLSYNFHINKVKRSTPLGLTKKLLFINPMHSVQTERYSFSLFNWEIALIFCWTNLRYIVIFTIDSYQERFWSASLDIDCNTPTCTCVDTENLAETFIGKLLSEEQNQTDWKSFQQCITFAKQSALVNTPLRLISTSTKKLL